MRGFGCPSDAVLEGVRRGWFEATTNNDRELGAKRGNVRGERHAWLFGTSFCSGYACM